MSFMQVRNMLILEERLQQVKITIYHNRKGTAPVGLEAAAGVDNVYLLINIFGRCTWSPMLVPWCTSPSAKKWKWGIRSVPIVHTEEVPVLYNGIQTAGSLEHCNDVAPLW
jgi:hypothetical protein